MDCACRFRRNSYPLPVPANEGWEPIGACQMLADYNLATLDYKPVGDGEWSGSSPFFQLGSEAEVWRNQLAFYVSGSQFAATELTLRLYVNVPDHASAAEEHFVVVSLALVEAAIGLEAVESLKGALSRLQQVTQTLDGTIVKLYREDWSGGAIKDGYDWTLKLARTR